MDCIGTCRLVWSWMAIIDMVELLHVVDVGMESDMNYFIIEHDGMETVVVGRDLKWIR